MKYSAYLLFYLALMLLLTGAFTHFSSGGLSVATGFNVHCFPLLVASPRGLIGYAACTAARPQGLQAANYHLPHPSGNCGEGIV